jgi:hypothetical protein
VKAKARVGSPFGRIAVVLALLGIALAVPAVAQAAQTHQLTSRAGEFGLGEPRVIAVDQSGGPTDGQIWTTAGVSPFGFVSLFTSAGQPTFAEFVPTTPFVSPRSLAVDNATGDAYVTDPGSRTIYKFSGTLTGPAVTELWEVHLDSLPINDPVNMSVGAVAVDPVTGHVLVQLPGSTLGSIVAEFDSSGNYLGPRSVSGIASAQRGFVVAGTRGYYSIHSPFYDFGEVDQYDAAGQYVRTLDYPDLDRRDGGGARAVSYDPTTDDVVVNYGSFIVIYNAAGDRVDKFGLGDLKNGSGVGIDGNTGVVVASDLGTTGPYSGGESIDLFSPVALPNLTTGAVSAIGQTTATLNGNVDPAGGGEVSSCEFEYGETNAYGQTAPCDPETPYATPTTVLAELTGLVPATEYHYRLKGGNANGSTHQEGDRTFITSPGAPQIVSQVVGELGSNSARINSMIKVMGADSTVFVEYGPTSAYGSSAPVGGKASPAAGPTDQEARQVSVQLLDLAPGSTYHYRIVVTNSAETVTGADQAFYTPRFAENALADGRAYELVTPVNKHAHSIIHEYGIATDNGEAVLYPAVIQIGNTASGYQAFGVSRRVGGEWISDSPYVKANEVSIVNYVAMSWASSDLSKIAFTGTNFSPDWDAQGVYLSNRTGTVRVSAGNLESVKLPEGAAPLFMTAGASSGLDKLYFTAPSALLAQDAVRQPAMATRDIGGFFEFRDGELLPADTLPDGSLDPEGAVPAATPTVHNANFSIINASRLPAEFHNQVSADGSRAFFVSPDPGAGSPRPVELYVHRDGQASLLVSRSDLRGGPAATGAVPMPASTPSVTNAITFSERPYASASPNGSHVFFESQDQLTADAPADTAIKGYLFDVDTQQLSYLPGVTGAALDISNDGSRIFFVDGEELSLWEAGVGVTGVSSGSSAFTVSTATPDGSALVFTPATPPSGFNNGEKHQVYLYKTADRELDCVSCPPAGATPTAGSYLAGEKRLNVGNSLEGQLQAPHYYADGRVFFETAQTLAVNDTNSASDVYEWESGDTHLISDGRSLDGSFLVDSSASGDDAFFVTSEGLDPRDRDGGPDVYDARVGGGTSAVTGTTACGSSCQGEPSSAPNAPNVASIGFEGRESATKPRLSARRRSAHGSSFSLAVKAPGKGRLIATGKGVGKVSKVAAKAGTYQLTLTLDSRAREKLKEEGSLTLHVRVVFTPADGKPSTTSVPVTLKA